MNLAKRHYLNDKTINLKFLILPKVKILRQHLFEEKIKKIFNLYIVRTRFVADRNSVGFARKKAQTISFVERGFERLGLGRQAVGFSWCSYKVKFSFTPGAFLLEVGWEALVSSH